MAILLLAFWVDRCADACLAGTSGRAAAVCLGSPYFVRELDDSVRGDYISAADTRPHERIHGDHNVTCRR